MSITGINMGIILCFLVFWISYHIHVKIFLPLIIMMLLWVGYSFVLHSFFGGYIHYFIINIFGFPFGLGGYSLHFFIFLESLYLFFKYKQSNKNNQYNQYNQLFKDFKEEDNQGFPLMIFSSIVMNLVSFSLLILLMIMNYLYPNGHSFILLSRLFNWYFLEPMIWYGIQILLMCVWFVHRKWIMNQSVNIFTTNQLQMGFLMILLIQFFYVFGLYPILRFLLYFFGIL